MDSQAPVNVSGAPSIEEWLQEITRRLVEAAHPERILLFGSYARGDITRDSDLDLLVILPQVHHQAAESVRLRRVLSGIPMPIDVIVVSVGDLQERGHLRGTMLYHALREGRTLYAAA